MPLGEFLHWYFIGTFRWFGRGWNISSFILDFIVIKILLGYVSCLTHGCESSLVILLALLMLGMRSLLYLVNKRCWSSHGISYMVKTLNVAFSACVLPCVVKITMILVIILSFSSVLLVINSANIDEITRDTVDKDHWMNYLPI